MKAQAVSFQALTGWRRRPEGDGEGRKGPWAPSVESLFGATLVLFGVRLGVLPIGDNSAFTHIRTGVDIVDGFGIPDRDPYSFTARGSSWVVQSWLPEWSYGWANRLGGLRLVVVEQALLFAVLAWLIYRLARTGSPLRTGLAATVAVGLGAGFWAPRPLMFGLICMALTVTIVEGRFNRWWLVPVVWLWVQSHGSFPLGLAWLGARAAGEWLDVRAWPRQSVQYAVAFVAGLAVAVINPLGARLLTFPFSVGDKREVFQAVREWQSPNFQRSPALVTLVFLVLAIVLLLRLRPPWRDAVPVVAFTAAGLIAVRNLPVAAVVFAPVLGRALRGLKSASPGPVLSASRVRINRAILATVVLAAVLFGASVYSSDPLDVETYPEDAVSHLEQAGLLRPPHRLAHQDATGNYLELRFGRTVPVFYDDRFDMYPLSVSKDYVDLLGGKPHSLGILDRHRVDVVLWEKDQPLVTVLGLSDTWHEIYRKGDFVAFQRG